MTSFARGSEPMETNERDLEHFLPSQFCNVSKLFLTDLSALVNNSEKETEGFNTNCGAHE